MRVGFGFDVHQLVKGRELILGGVTIPSEMGLDGHSDADVLLHAITDALLGATALGDIGSLFPDTDDQFRGANSAMLLKSVVDLLAARDFVVRNIDTTVALEAPKLRPYIDEMRNQIALIVGIDVGRVSVKATTTERMGFVGRGEGASAYAVALVEGGPA